MEPDLSQTNTVFPGKTCQNCQRGDEIEIDGGVTANKIYCFDGNWTMNREPARLMITPITP